MDMQDKAEIMRLVGQYGEYIYKARDFAHESSYYYSHGLLDAGEKSQIKSEGFMNLAEETREHIARRL